MPALLIGVDQGPISDRIGHHTSLPHCLAYLYCHLWALLAGAEQSGVGDRIGRHALQPHCLEQLQGLLSQLGLLTNPAQGIVGDDIGHLALPQRLEQLWGLLWLLALLTGPDQGHWGPSQGLKELQGLLWQVAHLACCKGWRNSTACSGYRACSQALIKAL